MSPVQIIRTIAIALISGGGALGLVPTSWCGAGWWSFPMPEVGYAAFGLRTEEPLRFPQVSGCEVALAPVGSWAVALVAAGVALIIVLRMNDRRPTTTQDKPEE